MHRLPLSRRRRCLTVDEGERIESGRPDRRCSTRSVKRTHHFKVCFKADQITASALYAMDLRMAASCSAMWRLAPGSSAGLFQIVR